MPMIDNCGLTALRGIMQLKNVSMFTLIHLARDNGMKFYFCKMDVDKLATVPRPAILHSHNHFVLVEDNIAIPDDNYTGWVLSPKPVGMTLPYSLAKQINGGKKGGDILGPIVVGLGSIINPLLGAGLGAAFGGYQVFGGGGVTAKPGEWWRIPIGGALGYLGGVQKPIFGSVPNYFISGALGGINELPGAIKSGNYAAPILGALGAGLGQRFTSGAAAGLAGSAPGTSLGGKIGNAFQGGLGAFGLGGGPGGAAATAGLPQTGGATGALSGMSGHLTGLQAATPAPGTLLSGSAYGSSAGFNPAIAGASSLLGSSGASGALKLAQAPSGAGGGFSSGSTAIPSSTGGASGAAGGGGGLFGNLLGGNKGNLLTTGLGLAATAAIKPPTMNFDPMQNYNAAQKYLGENTSLPKPTMDQLNSYVTSSIADIKKQIYNPDSGNAALLNMDKQYEEQLKQVQRLAANSGQDLSTSSDVQRQYQEINRQWADAKSNLQAQLDQQATTQAVEIKQWALQQSIQQGQFDLNSAMELAAQVGMQEQLQYAVASKNYEMFQQIVAKLLDPGLSSTTTTSYSNGQTSTSTTKQSGGLLSSVLGG